MFRVSIHIESESTVVLLFKKIHGFFARFGKLGSAQKIVLCVLSSKKNFPLYHFQFHHIIRVKSFSFLYSSENYEHFASSLLSRGKSFNGVF